MRRLSRRAFYEWLCGFKEDATVGWTLHSRACPLATFLGNACVSKAKYRDLSGGEFKALPKWARLFIEAVDGIGEGRRVQANQALIILKEIK